MGHCFSLLAHVGFATRFDVVSLRFSRHYKQANDKQDDDSQYGSHCILVDTGLDNSILSWDDVPMNSPTL